MIRPRIRRAGFNRGAGCATAVGMSLTLTFSLLAGFLGLAVFAGWRGARPPDLMRGPRLVPWRFLMMLAACGALILLVHAVNLLGVKTGR
jgi:hypothetical protein